MNVVPHRPEIGITISDHIAKVIQMIDVEAGAEIETQAEEKAVVAVAAVVIIHSVDRPKNPLQTVLIQNRMNDGQMINMMKMKGGEMYHGAAITTTTMTKAIDTMNHGNGMALAMINKQSDNLNRILWIHGVQNVK